MTGPSLGDYQWLRLDFTKADVESVAEPSWWCVVMAGAEPDQADLDFLVDAEFGSTEIEVPEQPPGAILATGDGTRWYGVVTGIESIARQLRDATPNAVWFGGSQEVLWLLDADGQPVQAWGYRAEVAEPPPDADRFGEVDVAW